MGPGWVSAIDDSFAAPFNASKLAATETAVSVTLNELTSLLPWTKAIDDALTPVRLKVSSAFSRLNNEK